MIRINLLPFRAARKKENVRRQISIFLLSFLLILVAVIYYNMYLSGKIDALNTRIQNTRQEVAKYNKINKEIAQIKKKLDILNKKIEVVKRLEADRKAPVILLESMSDLLVPRRMWFTSLQEKPALIEIKGVALDNTTIADFMTRLEQSKYYAGISLKSIKQKKLASETISLKSFNISVGKAASQEAEKEKAKKK